MVQGEGHLAVAGGRGLPATVGLSRPRRQSTHIIQRSRPAHEGGRHVGLWLACQCASFCLVRVGQERGVTEDLL